MKNLFCYLLVFLSLNLLGQKKILDHPDFDIWNSIQRSNISSNGDYVMYSLVKGEKDSELKIKDDKGNLIFKHDRSENNRFTYDSKFVLFNIKAWKDSIVEMKRRKVKKNKMPMDTLAIYNLEKNILHKIPNIKSYKIPEKWAPYVAYHYDEKKSEKKKDTTKTKKNI